jgi:hypothetical protein
MNHAAIGTMYGTRILGNRVTILADVPCLLDFICVNTNFLALFIYTAQNIRDGRAS